MKVKGVDVSALTKRQQGATKRHAKHHSAATLRKMVAGMKKGKKPAIRKDSSGKTVTKRYLPDKAWKKLSSSEKAATNKKKTAASKKGKQFVKNTKAAAKASKSARSTRKTTTRKTTRKKK
jgi:hypothetical protein